MQNDHDWLKLAAFEEACRYFDDVRTATHYRVLMPDDRQRIVTRAALVELSQSPNVDRIAYYPLSHPE